MSELDEADRRAGAAERKLAYYIDWHEKNQAWLSEAKRAEGYGNNTPFDEVWANLRAERDRLRAALEADPIRSDTERLDWLDAVNAKANERNGTSYGWAFDINQNRAALTDHNHPARTIRQAIDVAACRQNKP